MIKTSKLHQLRHIAKFENVFAVEILRKPPPRITSQNLGNFQEK